MPTFTSLQCDAGVENNIDELRFSLQLDLKALYNLVPCVFPHRRR